MMPEKYKRYIKINIVPILFMAISFISITFAWFAYSGTAGVETIVNVKAWYIKLTKDDTEIDHQVVISLDQIHPGMETVTETIEIENMGDSDANVFYQIESARILGDEEHEFFNGETTTEIIEDKISHDYPFHINLNLSKNYALAKDEKAIFKVSISWPLDSDDDEADSYWGQEAYKFHEEEKVKAQNQSDYVARPSVQVFLNLRAEQRIDNDQENNDVNYNLGDAILFDPVNNVKCSSVGETCYKMNVVDTNNKYKDEDVNVILDPVNTVATSNYNNYVTSFNTLQTNWLSPLKMPDAEKVLSVIATDIENTVLSRDNLSDRILGYLGNKSRVPSFVTPLTSNQGYYTFKQNRFSYLSSTTCYWVDNNEPLAIKREGDNLNLYQEDLNNECKIIPILTIKKELL